MEKSNIDNFNPCRDHCYIKYNKQYSQKCDTTCDYAKAIADVKKYKTKYEKINKKYKELCNLYENDGK